MGSTTSPFGERLSAAVRRGRPHGEGGFVGGVQGSRRFRRYHAECGDPAGGSHYVAKGHVELSNGGGTALRTESVHVSRHVSCHVSRRVVPAVVGVAMLAAT